MKNYTKIYEHACHSAIRDLEARLKRVLTPNERRGIRNCASLQFLEAAMRPIYESHDKQAIENHLIYILGQTNRFVWQIDQLEDTLLEEYYINISSDEREKILKKSDSISVLKLVEKLANTLILLPWRKKKRYNGIYREWYRKIES